MPKVSTKVSSKVKPEPISLATAPIYHAIKLQGDMMVSEDAVNLLKNRLLADISKCSVMSQKFAKHSNRKLVTAEDVQLAIANKCLGTIPTTASIDATKIFADPPVKFAPIRNIMKSMNVERAEKDAVKLMQQNLALKVAGVTKTAFEITQIANRSKLQEKEMRFVLDNF